MNEKHRWLVSFVLGALCVVGGARPAHAQAGVDALVAIGEAVMQGVSAPSLGGPLGVVSLPTAVPAEPGQWQAALSYQSMRAPSVSAQGPVDLSVWSLHAARGLSETSQVWAGYSVAPGEDGFHVWGLGGRQLLTDSEAGNHIGVAVGASYQQWRDALLVAPGPEARPDAGVTKAYAVVSRPLTQDDSACMVLGTAGLMYLGLDPDQGDRDHLVKPFVALQAFPGLVGPTVEVEYRGKDRSLEAKPVFSAALRQVLGDGFTVEVGTTNASPVGTGLPAQRVFMRVSRVM